MAAEQVFERDKGARPHVVCHMMVSLDGRIHPSRWTASPDGTRGDWSRVYEEVHAALDGHAWIVGRVTMAEPRPSMAAGASRACSGRARRAWRAASGWVFWVPRR